MVIIIANVPVPITPPGPAPGTPQYEPVSMDAEAQEADRGMKRQRSAGAEDELEASEQEAFPAHWRSDRLLVSLMPPWLRLWGCRAPTSFSNRVQPALSLTAAFLTGQRRRHWVPLVKRPGHL